MRTVFSSLLCVSLLIHAVLGCCWHDKHDKDGGAGSVASLEADSCCDHDHNHDAAADGHGPHAPCKGHPNCHGLCHYLPVQKSSFGKCLIDVPVDFAVNTQAAAA